LRRSLGPTITIRIAVDESLPPVLIDPHQFELGLLNLALNARDAMPEGGHLAIEAQHEKDNPGIAGRVHGSYVRISVTDSGMGMDHETLKRATEPFFTTKGVGKGTGLGLSMVQGLVVQSGGTMQIHSQPGQGTSIRLWLPIADTAVRATHVGVSGPGSHPVQVSLQNASSGQILVVDDDPLILSSARAMLEDLGHVVTVASSGAEALVLLQDRSNMDVVMTDYAMPGMNGFELATLIRQQWPDLPVIIASAYADYLSIEQSPFRRLAKPYTQKEIASSIDRAMHEGRPAPHDEKSARSQ
jgi:CheY-like chemotaxis protein